MLLYKLKFFIFLGIVSFKITELNAQVATFNSFFFGTNEATSKVSPINLISIGQYHLDDKWNAGNIYLKNGDSLIAYYMRYDLIKNHIELIIDTKIKAINGSFIKSFEWFSVDRLRPEFYLNKDSFRFEDSSEITGFIQVLEQGYCKLLKVTRVFTPIESASPTLVNNTDESIQMLSEFFIVISDHAHKVYGNKKKNLALLDSDKLSAYVSQSNLKFNNEKDLIKIVRHYNSLVKK